MAQQDANIEYQFMALVSLLANSALQHLGKVINPVTGKVEKNLEAAGMTIDWLRMIKIKTQGNLTPDEDRILSSYISNLQLNYVDEMNEKQKESASSSANDKKEETQNETK